MKLLDGHEKPPEPHWQPFDVGVVVEFGESPAELVSKEVAEAWTGGEAVVYGFAEGIEEVKNTRMPGHTSLDVPGTGTTKYALLLIPLEKLDERCPGWRETVYESVDSFRTFTEEHAPDVEVEYAHAAWVDPLRYIHREPPGEADSEAPPETATEAP